MKINVLVCSLALALLIGFLVNFSAQGWPIHLGSSCSIEDPDWWNSQTRAKANVQWQHPRTLWDRIFPHPHRVSYSVNARVGANNGDSTMDSASFMSSRLFTVPISVWARDSGDARWAGDAYASSSISAHNDPTNWRFCAKPEP